MGLFPPPPNTTALQRPRNCQRRLELDGCRPDRLESASRVRPATARRDAERTVFRKTTKHSLRVRHRHPVRERLPTDQHLLEALEIEKQHSTYRVAYPVKMKKLLVPIDGSGAALLALNEAIALARCGPGCSIVLVHAHEEPLVYGEIAVYVPRPKMAELQRQHSEDISSPPRRGSKTQAFLIPSKC